MQGQDSMKDAIARRRGKGIDITIAVGPHDESKDPHTDLAPEGHMEPAGPEHPMAAGPQGMPMEHPDAAADEAMMKEMASHMGGAEELPEGHKPRSLGERARMAFAKGKK